MSPQTVQQIVKGFLRRLNIRLSPDDLDDLIQDVHIELLKLRQRFKEEKGDWKSYAFCRIKGTILDYRKKKVSVSKVESWTSDAAFVEKKLDAHWEEDFWRGVVEYTGSYLLVERFKDGMKIKSLAKKYGVHKHTIVNWINSQLKVLKTGLKT